MNPSLVRFAYLPEVTLGILRVGMLTLCTLEERWLADPQGPGGQRREGALMESCVPDGLYTLKPHVSAHYPDGVYCLANPNLGVYAPGQRPAGQKWGRDAVLIHNGNTTENTEGCILVGLRHGLIGGKPAVLESVIALNRLRSYLGRAETQLLIRPTAGTSEILAA